MADDGELARLRAENERLRAENVKLRGGKGGEPPAVVPPAVEPPALSIFGKECAATMSLFDDSKTPQQVMEAVGHGGTSRMLAQATTSSTPKLSSLQHFFEPGSSLQRATAFVDVAEAKPPSLGLAQPGKQPPQLGVNENPVEEMCFANVGGSRVFYYYGLAQVRALEHALNAGSHIADTCVGVLMLDEYKIYERPGDPSNPLTFWPYQAFYVVPQGITFAKCKAVGESGADAGRRNPLEVGSICQALMALADFASGEGYKRLMITADCGYYALAAAAYCKQLMCWGRQSWQPDNSGPFAAFRVPHLNSPTLRLEIILALGTTQLISDPSPALTLPGRCEGGASVVYLTADARGWYGGDALARVNTAFAPVVQRSWGGDEEIGLEMIDVVSSCNNALLEAVAIADPKIGNAALHNVVTRLVEFQYGSTAYLMGLFLGTEASKTQEAGSALTVAQHVWVTAKTLRPLLLQMARAADGTAIKDTVELVAACQPFFDYLTALLPRVVQVTTKSDSPLDEIGEWRALAALVGNPAVGIDEPPPQTYAAMKEAVALRVQDTCLTLLAMDEARQQATIPLGEAYVDFYATFQVDLNAQVLASIPPKDRRHAIDGKQVLLIDCRHIPGFGKQVADGLTVFTAAKNFIWMSAIANRFTELAQQRKLCGPVSLMLECTELFAFTPFLQELGVPTLDAINMLLMSSRKTEDPMRFVTFKQDEQGFPPTPAALVADTSDGSVQFYRSTKMPLRSPTRDSGIYTLQLELFKELLQAQKERWAGVAVADLKYDDFGLKYGLDSYWDAAPGDSLYAASSAIDIPRYVPLAAGQEPAAEASASAATAAAGGAATALAAVQFNYEDEAVLGAFYSLDAIADLNRSSGAGNVPRELSPEKRSRPSLENLKDRKRPKVDELRPALDDPALLAYDPPAALAAAGV
jgi:hypothetical protein